MIREAAGAAWPEAMARVKEIITLLQSKHLCARKPHVDPAASGYRIKCFRAGENPEKDIAEVKTALDEAGYSDCIVALRGVKTPMNPQRMVSVIVPFAKQAASKTALDILPEEPSSSLINKIKAILKKYNLKPVGDEEFWNAHEDIQAKSPADAEKLEQLATELMELNGQTTMTAWGHFDKRTVAKVAKKLLDKGDVDLAREVLALNKDEARRMTVKAVISTDFAYPYQEIKQALERADIEVVSLSVEVEGRRGCLTAAVEGAKILAVFKALGAVPEHVTKEQFKAFWEDLNDDTQAEILEPFKRLQAIVDDFAGDLKRLGGGELEE